MLNYLHNYCITIIGGGFFAFRPFPYSPLGLVAAAGGRLRRRGHGHPAHGPGGHAALRAGPALGACGPGASGPFPFGGILEYSSLGPLRPAVPVARPAGAIGPWPGQGPRPLVDGRAPEPMFVLFPVPVHQPGPAGRLDGGRPALPGCQPGQAPFQPGMLERRGRLVWPVAAQAYGTAPGIGRAIPGAGAGGGIPHGGIVLCAGV